MGKMGQIFIIVGFVAIAYLELLIVVPFLLDVASATNTSLDASHNMSLYPGTSEAVLAIPWVLFFVPAFIGGVAMVITLRKT